MAGYLIYVPGEVNCDARVALPKLGLGELCTHAPPMTGTRVAAVAGPDGGQGVVFQHDWGSDEPDRNAVTGFRPDLQTWQPCKPWLEADGTRRPAGAFWLGEETGKPPTFDDLLRPQLSAAKAVVLKNKDGTERGRLLVPVPDVLPCDELLDVDDDGRPTVRRRVRADYGDAHAELSRLSGEFLTHYLDFKAQRDQGLVAEAQVNVDLVMRLASVALSVNYLVTPQILAWLGWFSDSTVAVQICAATIDEEAFEREWSAQKKTPIRIAG